MSTLKWKSLHPSVYSKWKEFAPKCLLLKEGVCSQVFTVKWKSLLPSVYSKMSLLSSIYSKRKEDLFSKLICHVYVGTFLFTFFLYIFQLFFSLHISFLTKLHVRPGRYSYQPVHLCSLIIVLAEHSVGSQGSKTSADSETWSACANLLLRCVHAQY